jgi:predicted DNA-binding transcriptional regulator AlpA
MADFDRFISLAEVSRLISRKKTWIYAQLKLKEAGAFPQPLRLAGGGHPVWSFQELNSWMREQREHAPRGSNTIQTSEATAARAAGRKEGAK